MNSSVNDQRTKKVKCDFTFFFIFKGLTAIDYGSTALCWENSELISVSLNQCTMNIWASKKDISIKHLLLLLNEVFKPGAYEIIDNDSDDSSSVRLCNTVITPIVLYLFTFGQKEGSYGVHIGYPNLQETSYYDTVEVYETIQFHRLVDIIKIKLEVDESFLQVATKHSRLLNHDFYFRYRF